MYHLKRGQDKDKTDLSVPEISHLKTSKNDSIVITDTPFDTSQKIIRHSSYKDAVLMSVTDQSSTQILYDITYELKKNNLVFSHKKGKLFKLLQEGKTVILYGDPSDTLLDHLWTLLLPKPYLWTGKSKERFRGKIILVTEKKPVLEKGFKQSMLLKDIIEDEEEEKIDLDNEETEDKISVSRVPRSANVPNLKSNDRTLEEFSKEFYENRRAVWEHLKASPAIIIEGETAVGKSFFMHQLNQEKTYRFTV
jgi:hypothetical protein